MCWENRLKRGVAGRRARGAGGEFNMYEKMHDAAGARERTRRVGLELPSIFIITFIRERGRRRRAATLHARRPLAARSYAAPTRRHGLITYLE